MPCGERFAIGYLFFPSKPFRLGNSNEVGNPELVGRAILALGKYLWERWRGLRVSKCTANSDALGKRASARRAPTDAERVAVMVLVKSIYSQNHTPASLISSIRVTNLTATDLDGDGKFEFIGSFTAPAKNKFERDLFLIAKSQGPAMRADFTKFQAYQPPPEGFLSSIDFVDQLDLDGDGVGEVFAMHGGFDAYGYLIFKRVGSRWRQVFEGTGDAC